MSPLAQGNHAVDQPHRGRLAGPRRADQHTHLASRDLEAERLNRRLPLARVALLDVAQLERRRLAYPLRSSSGDGRLAAPRLPGVNRDRQRIWDPRSGPFPVAARGRVTTSWTRVAAVHQGEGQGAERARSRTAGSRLTGSRPLGSGSRQNTNRSLRRWTGRLSRRPDGDGCVLAGDLRAVPAAPHPPVERAGVGVGRRDQLSANVVKKSTRSDEFR